MEAFCMKIYLRCQAILLFIFLISAPVSKAQTPTSVTGTITAASGAPVPGASVVNRRSGLSVAADAAGRFSIAGKTGDALEIAAVGFAVVKTTAQAGAPMKITMETAESKLQDVVVVGYGTQKKVDLSGSVTTVKVGNLVNRPVNSLTKTLQGQAPGVTVISRPGDVGGDQDNINIRGRGNLGSSSPLYVLDGIPIGADDFSRINPSDVESMSILKDAAAAAIYGSRAAFGVILVTTKRGREGRMQVDYNAYYGSQSPTVLPDVLGSVDYATLRNEAASNAGKDPVYTPEQIQKFRDGSDPDAYPNTDWYSLAYRKHAPIRSNEISVMGGGKTRYYMNANVMHQESLIPGKDLTRYSLRSNTETQVSDIFKVGTNISYIRDGFDFNGADFGPTTLARMIPAVVNKQSDGTWGTMNGGQVDVTYGAINPLRTLKEGGRSSYTTNRFITSLNGTLKPVKGLSFDGTISYNFYNATTSTFTNEMQPLINWLTKETIESTHKYPNRLDENWENAGNLLLQGYASYEHQWGKHYAKLMAGSSYEDYKYRNLTAFRKDFINNDLNAISAGSPGVTSADIGNSGSIQERAFNSYFGRFNYNFDERYLLEANVRRDASSQFDPSHRWGTFPSVSAAWRISQEAFLKRVKWIDELKLRGSWGKLGNVNNVGYYDYYDGMTTGTIGILNNAYAAGVYQTRLANPTLTWEVVDMTNLGLDGTLFNHALNIQVDAFKKITKNILLSMPVPIEWGVPNNTQPQNAAKVSNKGIELSLSHSGHAGPVSYTVGGNVSRVWNKILDMHGQDNQVTGDYYIYKQGEAIGAFYMYQAQGLFANDAEVAKHATQSTATKAGDIKYADLNGDGIIDGNDRKVVGNDVPYFTYGVNFSASYKGFDLNVMGQGVSDVQVYLPLEASWAFFNGGGVKRYNLQRWTKENPDPNAAYPRMLVSADNTQNQVNSSFWLFNGDYFRIKTLAIGYSLPAKVMKRLHLQKIRVYLSSNNIFTITADKRLKDFDPEMASVRASYPQLKSLSAGLNVTF